ncbi:MAG: hypothetical protein JW902_09885 [Syntrophaceae bacterium]|nr:hypothetical protein [Syntrophaceae bacterium]
MKHIITIMAIVFSFATMAFAADSTIPKVMTLPSPTPELKVIMGPCCISGHYLGNRQDTVCKPGETPGKGKFTMDIKQAARCGGTLTATVTDSKDGTVTQFAGTVAAGKIRGCCDISGKSTSATDSTSFKGIICKELTKWKAKGTFISANCSGTWDMQQP